MDAPTLLKIMPHCSVPRAELLTPHLDSAMQAASIASPQRQAAFLGQLALESGELRWMEEIWGPSPAQLRYERPVINGAQAPLVTIPPIPLWQRLGNTESGDGKKFKGHGPIQITGRKNHLICGQALGVDLIAHPELAATPEVAFRTATWFWNTHNLNAFADLDSEESYKKITLAINGGLNGYDHRVKYWQNARRILGLL